MMLKSTVKTPVQSLRKGEFQNPQLNFALLLIDPDHRQRVEQIARKQTRGTAIAWEDAAQTAHIKLLDTVKAGKFREGGVSEFYRWAATVARCEIINLVYRERLRHWPSLDQLITGTTISWLDTVADDFNLLDSVERSDLLSKALEILANLDRQYPDRNYLKLWQGKVQNKTQMQLAVDLGMTQGAISKRWQELVRRLTEAFEVLPDGKLTRPVSILSRDRNHVRNRSEEHRVFKSDAVEINFFSDANH